MSRLREKQRRRERMRRERSRRPAINQNSPMPSWEEISMRCTELAESRGEWAGYPVPIEDKALIVEPRHPLFKSMNGRSLNPKAERPSERHKILNTWHSTWRGFPICVHVVQREDGKSIAYVSMDNSPGARLKMLLDTLAPAHVWRIEAERTAMGKLQTLITDTAFRYYELCGFFLETSQRSQVTYVFRRGRPTLALRPTRSGDMTCIAALCLHPIAYYEGTFSGAMVPTDEVISHLTLMRGDECMYWRKANQHPIARIQSGI